MHDSEYKASGFRDLTWLLKKYVGIQVRFILRKDFTPPILNFLVTLRCDLRCRHCFLWNRLETPKASKELSLAEIERMASTMGPLFGLVLSGGEPFLHKDLVQIARIFYEHTQVKLLTILTDGQMPDRIEAVVREILYRCPEILVTTGVSLDGIGQRHDQIRQKEGAFERAVETVRRLKDLSRKEGRLSVQTCTVLMGLNEDHIFELYAFLRDVLRPDRIAVNLFRQDALDPGAKPVNPTIYRRLIRLIEQDTYKGRLRNRFCFDRFAFLTVADLTMTELICQTLVRNKPQIRCHAGRVSAVVFPDGTVYPCELKPSWGRLQDTHFHFSRFWFMRKRNAFAQGGPLTKDCFCTHEIDCFLPSIPFNLRLYPRLFLRWLRVVRGQFRMQERPDRLAVVIPALNEEAFIGSLLESLARQTYRNFEVVVVDSQSDDRTSEVASRFGGRLPALKIVRAPERGLALARNTGAMAAEAEDLVFMDADGVVSHTFLHDLVWAMRSRGLKSATTLVQPASRRLFDRFFYSIFLGWGLRIFQYFYPIVTGSCIVVQRETFERAGGFDTTIEFEDSAFARKAARYGRFGVLPRPRVTTSVRRLDHYGRWRTLFKLLFHGVLRRLLTGDMPQRKGFYRFGEYGNSPSGKGPTAQKDSQENPG